MKVLGVAGSLRRDSHNRTLPRAAASLLPPEVQFDEYDRLKLLPPFDEDDESAPALAVAHWRDAIAQADAILFATPEYNSSIPGQLKNAVRLGLPAGQGGRPAQQAGRRHRRKHERIRGSVATGRAA
jgi:chromate reductase